VSEEVALAERYLELQRMRFGGRLQYTLSVAPDVETCSVPVLLLQPLVENAVVHGMEAGVECLHITIAASAVAEGVELRVENDGAPVASVDVEARGTTSGSGVGIAATRARLITAYGDLASLRLSPREGGGASVRIIVPRIAGLGRDTSQSPSGSFAAAV
jgi:two-component system, LytTR family, sensor kinase